MPALIASEFDSPAVHALLRRLDAPLTVADDTAIVRHGLVFAGVTGQLISVDGSGAGAAPLEWYRGGAIPPAAPRADEELVAITHTSGTTGTPKLIRHTGTPAPASPASRWCRCSAAGCCSAAGKCSPPA
ncbi:hypothetical protein SAMN05661080_04749 [Modestobacter sp. DSM 44400]|uniref:hypothetical protein n=1 Tax=Modestobacter sp. DSM 44400 TaxID=1550230 RepID=UPI000898E3FF|nr:hypothetical protein [Modestobacter sp. DSM 44400]SDY83234.1 hypothetical protein SAMN05661080_04749 [Modestobacter sp. DSM 44400]